MSFGPAIARSDAGHHKLVRKKARHSSIATAWRPMAISGLFAVYGKLSGLENHPTELTVSHTPTKCGAHSRENVALNSFAKPKYCSMRGSGAAVVWLRFGNAWIAHTTGPEKGTSRSLSGGTRPYMCSIEATARTVYAPRLKPNR